MTAPRIYHKHSNSRAQVAQSVEQRTENPRVGGSIPPLGICRTWGEILKTKNTPLTKSTNQNSSIRSLFSKDPFEGAFLVLSPDITRRYRAEDAIIEEFLKRNSGATRQKSLRETLSGQELRSESLSALKDSVANLSLFAPVSIYRIRDVEEVKATVTDSLIGIIAGELPKVCLICSGASLPQTSKLLKAFNKNNSTIILSEPTREEAASWLEKESSRLKIKLTGEVKDSLLTIAESEHLVSETPTIDALRHLIERLSLSCDTEPTIQDVEFLFSRSHIASEYDFIDSLLAKRHGEAEILLTQLFRQGENSFLLLSLISRSLTNAYLIKELLSRGMRDSEIQNSLKINPWIYRKTLPAVQKLDFEKILNSIRAIALVDNRFKSTSLEAENLMSGLASSFCR